MQNDEKVYKMPEEVRAYFRQINKERMSNDQNFREKRRVYAKRWRENNPEKVKETNHQQYLRRKALKEEEKENGRSKTES